MLGSKTQYVAGYSGKKKIIDHPYYINKPLQYYFLNIRQPPYQMNEKPFYAALMHPTGRSFKVL